MIIAFEGLPYTGKTTLVQQIVKGLPELAIAIPEVVSPELADYEGAARRQASADFYYRNDEAKSRICASASESALVLLDRYFISTAVCRAALDTPWLPAAGDAQLRHCNGFVLPDVVLFLDLDNDALFERAAADEGSRFVGPWAAQRLDHLRSVYRTTLTHWSRQGMFALTTETQLSDVLALPLSGIRRRLDSALVR